MLHHVGIEIPATALPDNAIWDADWRAWLALDYVNIGGVIVVLEYVSSHPPRALGRHVCFEVANFDAIVARERVIAGPAPARLFNGRRVAFCLVNGEVVEYLEAESAAPENSGGHPVPLSVPAALAAP